MSDLIDLGTISVPSDNNGLTSRQCPNVECEGVFKIRVGTGLKGEDLPFHCPYCGHEGDISNFHTEDQIEYLRSVTIQRAQDWIKGEISKLDKNLKRSSRNSFLKFSASYKGNYIPTHRYEEPELETNIVCENCTLEYAIYGVYSYCPDCKTHSSIQIFNSNIELNTKLLSLALLQDDSELKQQLVMDALGNAVAAFDSFGKNLCASYSERATEPEKALNVSFQNLLKSKKNLSNLFGFDISSCVTTSEWEEINRSFQKRHVIAHNSGIADELYIKFANDTQAIVGRKISVRREDVELLLELLNRLSQCIWEIFHRSP